MATTFTILSNTGTPLNAAIDILTTRHSHLIDSSDQFKAIRGAKSLFGSGEAPVLKIIITYSDLNTNKRLNIDEIITIAKDAVGGDAADTIEVIEEDDKDSDDKGPDDEDSDDKDPDDA